MTRSASVAVVAALGLVAAGLAAGGLLGTAAAQGGVGISNVTVSPDTPTPGEPVTVTVTIRNPAAASGTASIGSVTLRNAGGSQLTEYARVTGVGSVSPGSRAKVPLHRTFEEPGTYRMQIAVNFDGSGRTIRYPVLVEVEPSSADEPKLDVSGTDLVAGTESTLDVTLVNSLRNDVLGGEITLRGDGLGVEDEDKVFARMDSGSQRRVNFTVSPSATGTVTAEATIRYTTDEGPQTAVKRVDLQVEAAEPELVVEARATSRNDSTVVETTLRNLGNVPLEDLSLTDDSGAATLSKSLSEPLAAGEQRTVDVAVDRLNATGSVTVPLVASYAAAGQELTTETTVELTANPGSIRLTGLRAQPEAGKVHLSGSASNVGLSMASAVLVEVVDTGNVTPASPNRDFFVGGVPANEFVTFDVYASLSGGASTVPLRVEYIVNGERHSRVVEVPVGSAGAAPAGPASGPGGPGGSAGPGGSDGPSPPSNAGSSGLGTGPLALAAVVVVALGGAMLRGWRKRRDGD